MEAVIFWADEDCGNSPSDHFCSTSYMYSFSNFNQNLTFSLLSRIILATNAGACCWHLPLELLLAAGSACWCCCYCCWCWLHLLKASFPLASSAGLAIPQKLRKRGSEKLYPHLVNCWVLPCMEGIYKDSMLKKTRSITGDQRHPLAYTYNLLPSGSSVY